MIPTHAIRLALFAALLASSQCPGRALPAQQARGAGEEGRPMVPKAEAAGPVNASSVAGSPSSAALSVNRLTMWANSDGVLGYNSARQGPGVVYPRGSSTVVSREGLVWGGFVRDGGDAVLRIGGQTFQSGTIPGRIVRPGVAENPSSQDVRIFRIRRDWAKGDLRRDAAESYGIPDVLVTPNDLTLLREQYRRDWLEWPWEKGAPYYERNGIPGYQPVADGLIDSLGDEPGLADADQRLVRRQRLTAPRA